MERDLLCIFILTFTVFIVLYIIRRHNVPDFSCKMMKMCHQNVTHRHSTTKEPRASFNHFSVTFSVNFTWWMAVLTLCCSIQTIPIDRRKLNEASASQDLRRQGNDTAWTSPPSVIWPSGLICQNIFVGMYSDIKDLGQDVTWQGLP